MTCFGDIQKIRDTSSSKGQMKVSRDIFFLFKHQLLLHCFLLESKDWFGKTHLKKNIIFYLKLIKFLIIKYSKKCHVLFEWLFYQMCSSVKECNFANPKNNIHFLSYKYVKLIDWRN